MPQEDDGASELNHPEEIFWVVFPANDGATKIMKPGEQSFHFPATPVAAQDTPVLRRCCDAHKFMRRDELHAISLVDALIQRIAVVSTVTDHAFREFRQGIAGRAWVRRVLFHEAKRWPRTRREENHGRLRLP